MNNLKQEILEAAKKRFQRFGYKKTSLDEICTDLKISKKTIYQHFENKENLFTSLFVQEALIIRKAIFDKVGNIQDFSEKFKKIDRKSVV